MRTQITYLAIPYSWFPELSYEIANEIAADHMKRGIVMFSPISHSHSISKYLPSELIQNMDYWMKMDLPILDRCDRMILVVIGDNGHQLISESVGCLKELELCKDRYMNLSYYHYELSEEQLKRIKEHVKE